VQALTHTPGDYFEMKIVHPTFATNPAATIYGGHIFIK
jgi:hypothetical protein